MRDRSIQAIANEISTLQSKLGLLRSELYRSPEELSDSKKAELEAELYQIESAIDSLQNKYKKKKEVCDA
ncbi:hypothetical protein [Reichenbachiella sp.]|uniref:hypothetical protein n=1 Tax=Reichenbachiella sp. TaxID=2184521 RepID=UPI003B5976C7